jgi:hypothetical protein
MKEYYRRCSFKKCQGHHSPPYSTFFYASEDSLRVQKCLMLGTKRKLGLDSLQGELRKIKPPSFDGEREREDDVEAWLLGLISYFQLHKYSSNLEARISTYHSHGKATMLWDQLKQVEHINEGRITWKQFKTYFQKEYLSKNFYDKKMEEFFELRLGSMTMAEYENTFPGLLKYVGFIKDEKVKLRKPVLCFLLCTLHSFQSLSKSLSWSPLQVYPLKEFAFHITRFASFEPNPSHPSLLRKLAC